MRLFVLGSGDNTIREPVVFPLNKFLISWWLRSQTLPIFCELSMGEQNGSAMND